MSVWSLVGSAGALAQSSTSPLTANAGQASTNHNLLTCRVAIIGSTSAPSLPAGWVLRTYQVSSGTPYAAVYIFDYLNCPAGVSSVAVTFSGGTAAAMVAEYTATNSQNAVADAMGTLVGAIGSPFTIVTSGLPAATDELAISATAANFSAATTTTLSPGSNFTQQRAWNNAASATGHAAFDHNLATLSGYDDAVLADNPVLFVKGDLTDHGTGSHTITKTGTPAATATLPNGDAGWAFDNTGTQYLSVADANDLSVPTGGALTVECWLSPSAVNQPHSVDTGYVNFLGKAGWNSTTTTNQYEWEFRYFNQNTTDTGNAGESLCGYAYPTLNGGTGFGHDDNAGVTVGQWVHMVVVYDSTASPSKVTIYRNGTQVNSTTYTGTPQNGADPLTIGSCETMEAGNSFWYGSLGKVAVYSSVLSASRISAHYKAMTASAYDTAVLADTPVLYYNDASGTDATGNGHTLTAHNSPTSSATLPNGDTCWKFDNTGTQYCETPDANDISPVTTGVMTFEAWISPDANTTSPANGQGVTFPHEEAEGYVHWGGKGVTNEHEYVHRMYGYDNTASPFRENRTSGYAYNITGGTGNGAYFETKGGEWAGKWIHYVQIIDSTDTQGGTYPNGYVTIYRNGVQTNTQSLTGITLANGTAPLRLGTRDFGSYWYGRIGKYAIYNYHLSAARINAHYNIMSPASDQATMNTTGTGNQAGAIVTYNISSGLSFSGTGTAPLSLGTAEQNATSARSGTSATPLSPGTAVAAVSQNRNGGTVAAALSLGTRVSAVVAANLSLGTTTTAISQARNGGAIAAQLGLTVSTGGSQDRSGGIVTAFLALVTPRYPLQLGGQVADNADFDGSLTLTAAHWAYTATGSLVTYAGTASLATTDASLNEWTMTPINITLAEWNDEQLSVTITSGGSAVNLTGYEVDAFFKTKAGVSDSDPSTIKLSTTTGGITITNAAAGQCVVNLPASDLQTASIGFYRIDAVDSNGKRNTAVYGTVNITLL